MKRLGVAVLTAALLLTGCGPDEPKKGWVVARGHSSAWTQWIVQYNCYARDKNGICINQVQTQTPIEHPERWWLILKKENSERDKAYVSSEVWESQPVGSWYAEAPAR